MPAEQLVELLHVGPFGGLDLTTDPGEVSPTLAVDMANIVPYRTYGQYVAAKGRQANVAGTLANATNFLPFISSTNLAFISYSAAGVLQGGTLGGGAFSNIALPSGVVYTAGLKIRGEVYGGYAYITDGVDQPLKIPQSSPLTSTNWGINPPTGSLTTTVGAAGVLLGNYYWCYTYLVSATGQESSHSPISNVLALTNQQANVPYTASLDPQVDKINIYRLGGSNASWILEATVNNATSSFTSTAADTSLTGQTLVLHRDPPPAFRAVCAHKDRMFGFGYDSPYPFTFTAANTYSSTPAQPSDLWFSRYAEPGSFDAVNSVLPVGRNSYGDTAVGMCSNGSILFCFKKFSTQIVLGDSEQDFRPVPALGVGAYSQELIAAAYGLAFWVSPDGNAWAWDGQSAPNNISEGDPQKGSIQDALNQANGNFSGWTMAISRRVLYISTGTVTYGYYMKTGTWHKHNYASRWLAAIVQYPWIGGLSPTNTGIDTWFGQEGDGYLNPYTQFWTTGVYDCGKPASRKQIKYVIVKIPPGDITNSVLKVTLTLDGVDFPLPGVYPRAVASNNQGAGGWYYRLSCQPGTIGYSVTVRLDTQCAGIPFRISEVKLYGTFTDDFQPNNPTVFGGGT